VYWDDALNFSPSNRVRGFGLKPIQANLDVGRPSQCVEFYGNRLFKKCPAGLFYDGPSANAKHGSTH
jgi:hypothetical protein